MLDLARVRRPNQKNSDMLNDLINCHGTIRSMSMSTISHPRHDTTRQDFSCLIPTQKDDGARILFSQNFRSQCRGRNKASAERSFRKAAICGTALSYGRSYERGMRLLQRGGGRSRRALSLVGHGASTTLGRCACVYSMTYKLPTVPEAYGLQIRGRILGDNSCWNAVVPAGERQNSHS